MSTRTAPGTEYGPECGFWLECTYIRLLMFIVCGAGVGVSWYMHVCRAPGVGTHAVYMCGFNGAYKLG